MNRGILSVQPMSPVKWLLFLWVLLGANIAIADGNVAYWLAPRSNVQINGQVAQEIGSRAGLIVLRAARSSPDAAYTFPNLVARLKKNAPQTPVLSYALVSRLTEKGRIEADLLKGANIGKPVVEVDDGDQEGRVKFLDITDAKVRDNVVKRLSAERSRLGVDGFALDLSMRTPSVRPAPLAKVCQTRAGYCESYSEGMDKVFIGLRDTLGKGGYLVYNGLWNFTPGMLEDQARLLAQADAVAVEYFGMDPSKPDHNFSSDVLPYLKIIPRLPKDKSVLVFARGPWKYTDYVADYRWQRYLFASYLLVKREGDLFKYHASFQIPAHKGRAGGLDVYADWNIRLGDALGPFSVQGGLYQREFSHGMVVVAPDDGAGGKIRIAGTRFTPEGDSVSGEVQPAPGTALILLKNVDKENSRPVAHVYSANNIASWGWSNAQLGKTPEGDRLKLTPLPAQLEGEHDLLLDYERSPAPYERLEISAKLPDPSSAVLAVAEVDDPKGKYNWVVVEISRSQDKADKHRMLDAPQFRTPHRKAKEELWPLIHIEYKPDNKNTILLDGAKVLSGTDYHFRRWSHVRFAGALEVSEVSLSAPKTIRNIQNN